MTGVGFLLLAAALVTAAGRPGAARLRGLHTVRAAPHRLPPRATVAVGGGAAGLAAWAVLGGVTGLVVGTVLAGAVATGLRRVVAAADGAEPADLAPAWQLLAVCLEAGLPVPVAVAAAAEACPGDAASRLRRVGGLIALGADSAQAWAEAVDVPALGRFARAAVRSAGTGAALAQVARAECTRSRAGLVDAAQARAQRAAVRVTGPLGLCFLPAFLVLGVAPLVVGLAGEVFTQWD